MEMVGSLVELVAKLRSKMKKSKNEKAALNF
jgi:hypothetical protein